jgi:hypothetical protein
MMGSMYVYLTLTGAEVWLPTAVEATLSEQGELVLKDASGQVVAVFPARLVIVYGRERLPQHPEA